MTDLPNWARERISGRKLGPGAARVIETIELQPQMASYASTAEIAERANVNIATVVRTAQLLGFSGWSDLRLEIRNRYLASLSAVQVLNQHTSKGASRTRDAVVQDIANLESLASAIDPDAISAVGAAVAEARRTVVIGSGSFAAPGLQLAHVGRTMGFDIRLQRGGGTTLFNEVGLLGPGDALVVFSFWWIAKEIMEAARIASYKNVTVILVTDRQSSPFTDLADQTIVIPSEGVSLFPSLTAAMTVVHCVLAEIAGQNEDSVRSSINRAEALWRSNDLFAPS